MHEFFTINQMTNKSCDNLCPVVKQCIMSLGPVDCQMLHTSTEKLFNSYFKESTDNKILQIVHAALHAERLRTVRDDSSDRMNAEELEQFLTEIDAGKSVVELRDELHALARKFAQEASDPIFDAPNLSEQRNAIVTKCDEIVKWINANEVGI